MWGTHIASDKALAADHTGSTLKINLSLDHQTGSTASSSAAIGGNPPRENRFAEHFCT